MNALANSRGQVVGGGGGGGAGAAGAGGAGSSQNI